MHKYEDMDYREIAIRDGNVALGRKGCDVSFLRTPPIGARLFTRSAV